MPEGRLRANTVSLGELNAGCGVIVFTVLLVVEFYTGFLSAQDIKQRNKIYTNVINFNMEINAVVAGEFAFCSPSFFAFLKLKLW